MKILVLEDDSYRVTTFIEKFCNYELCITENAGRAVEYLEEIIFDYIFLDHDLGLNNGCGADVAAYLANNPNNTNNKSNIIIHSWNIPAVEAMQNKLPQAEFIPFGSDLFFVLGLDN